MMSPAHAVVEQANSTFRWGMKIVPAEKRPALYAIYAYCRMVDDIADSDLETDKKEEELSIWRARIETIEAGQTPDHPVAESLSEAVQTYGIEKKELLALIDGMEMDMRAPLCAPSWETLHLYCRRVAGSVGRLCMPVFGENGKTAHQFAHTLGEALQLTNILRDVEEDAEMGRLYLPREILETHRVPLSDPSTALASPGFSAAFFDLAETAERQYRNAYLLLERLDRKRVKPALAMAAAYHTILKRLKRRGPGARIPSKSLSGFLCALRVLITGRP